MVDLSLKGIMREYRGITGNFTISSPTTGTFSLRSELETLARTEFNFSRSECIYGWTAAFEQTWTHIRIRISLNPDAGINNATITTLQNTWRNGIETTWNDKWGCSRNGELACRLTFEVNWVNSNQHHTVRVRRGPARSNMTTWDTSDTGAVAAHEFGHMLGHSDEYTDINCPSRSPVNTGTVMDDNSNDVPSRLMERFANNIGSNVVSI